MPADPLEALRQPVVPIAPAPPTSPSSCGRAAVGRGAGSMAAPPSTPSATRRDVAAVTPALVGPTSASTARPPPSTSTARRSARSRRCASTGDDGRVGHAEMHLGGHDGDAGRRVSPRSASSAPRPSGGHRSALYLDVADVDATYARAVAAGATGERPPADQFYGDRNGIAPRPVRPPLDASRSPSRTSPSRRWPRRAPDYTVTRGGRASGRARGPGADRPARATSPCRRPTSTGPRPSTARCSAGTSSRRRPGSDGRHRYSHVEQHDGAVRHPSTTWTTRAPTTTTGSTTCRRMVARVRELGGEVLAVDEYASGGNARCRDDQGIEFELWQPAPGY